MIAWRLLKFEWWFWLELKILLYCRKRISTRIQMKYRTTIFASSRAKKTSLIDYLILWLFQFFLISYFQLFYIRTVLITFTWALKIINDIYRLIRKFRNLDVTQQNYHKQSWAIFSGFNKWKNIFELIAVEICGTIRCNGGKISNSRQ